MKLSPAPSRRAAFTMIEVAMCLAIIGIALVSIIGVLPRGMNTQRDNREQTIIGQDANQLMQIIQSGARAQDDLTNYVYAVTNYWTCFNPAGNIVASGVNGYNYFAAITASQSGSLPANPFQNLLPLNSGSNIVSVLSTPEMIWVNTTTITNLILGQPIPTLLEGGVSNHVVAYVRALSGLAAEEEPQTNAVMQGDMFSYRVLCVNAPIAMNFQPWQAIGYDQGANVYTNGRNWTAAVGTLATDVPGGPPNNGSTNWVRNLYLDQLAYGQREIRLRFTWPILPNGNVGNNFQSFRSTVGGQLAFTNNQNTLQYYYQPQSYVAVP